MDFFRLSLNNGRLVRTEQNGLQELTRLPRGRHFVANHTEVAATRDFAEMEPGTFSLRKRYPVPFPPLRGCLLTA